MNVISQLKQFLRDNSHRHVAVSWLCDGEMEVYVRKNRRHLDGKTFECLDIANIGVYVQGRGTFTEFLGMVEEINPYPLLFVENVLEERFAAFFEKRGYTKFFPPGGEDGPPSFYRLRSNGPDQEKHG